MVRLLRIERSITWIAKALTANRDANPTPEGVIDVILPNVDIFGTQRVDQMQFATVLGALGNIEAFHTTVPAGFYRRYLTMEYSNDDPVAQDLRGGMIVSTPTGFPFAALKSDVAVPQNTRLVLRNFTVPPGGRAAATAVAVGIGARLTLTLLWIEAPVGEYLRGIV